MKTAPACGGFALHLEDHPDVAYIIQNMLGQAGFSVEGASTCDAFFQSLNRRKPDLFILDVQLPDGSGLDVLRQIRLKREYDRVPAVVLTALDSPNVAMDGFERGANAFLVKMPTFTRLMATVKMLMNECRSGGKRS